MFGEALILELTDPSSKPSPEAQKQMDKVLVQEKHQKELLTGRVQELTKSEPPRLRNTAPKLSTPKPPLAQKPSAPDKAAKELTAYPSGFEGEWIGPAAIDQHVFSEAVQELAPQQAAADIGFLYPGRIGICSVSFQSTQAGVTLKDWPRVTFHLVQADSRFVGKDLQPGAQLFVGTAPAHDVILGDGSTKNSQQLFNKLTQYKIGVVEQDFGEVSQTQSKRQVQQIIESRENVIYYSVLDDDRMYIYIAQVDYLKDGAFKSKLLMHGILRRKGSWTTSYFAPSQNSSTALSTRFRFLGSSRTSTSRWAAL
jgi:hypothetical protein